MKLGSRPPAVLLLLAILLVATVGGALPASADDAPAPLAPRHLFDQSRPGVELILATFTGQLAVPEPRITAADQRVLQAHVVDKIQRGEVAADETAARNAVIQEIIRDPVRWFTPGDRIDRLELEVRAMGSGFSISADGYIVTNAHVVAPRGETLKWTFLREGFGDQFQDSVAHLVQGGVSQSLATKLLDAALRWATRTSKLSHFKRRLEAVTSSGTGRVASSERGRPAELITAGKEIPGKDVAIIKVDAANMATVQLGDDSALSTGDRLFVLGFPGPATFSPVLSKESEKEPTLTQGVLSAKKTTSKGLTVLQTDAAMTHGNSGGPVLDEQGRVVGVATFGSVDPQTGREVAGLNFAVPVSVVSEMLKRAKVRPVEGAATEKYRLALDAFEKHWYKRALPLFKEVQRLDPAHPLVSKFIKDSQRAIAQGRDQTPREILGLPFVPVVASAALLGLLTVTIPARGLARRRRRARGRAGPGAPAQPGSAWPGAGWPEPGPSGQPDLPAWPDLPARPGPSARPGTAVYPVPTAPIGFNPNGNGSPAPAMAAGQATAAQPSAVQAWRPPSADDTAELPVATPAGRWDGHVPERRRPRQASPSLDCPSCGQPNPATNRFCEQCWSALRS